MGLNAKRILTIGAVYKTPRGGIAAVEKTYSSFYHPFNHIATVTVDNWIKKLLLLVKAYFLFLIKMFNSEIEIVHVHGASNASFWRKSIFILTAKCFKKKILYHIHGGGFMIFTVEISTTQLFDNQLLMGGLINWERRNA